MSSAEAGTFRDHASGPAHAPAGRWAHWAGAALLTIVIGATGAAFEARRVRPVESLPTLMLAPLTRGAIRAAVTAPGELSSSFELDVTAPATGRVIDLVASPGSPVRHGQVLARLDPLAARASVARAEAALVSAEVESFQAELRLFRLKRAADRGADDDEDGDALSEGVLAAEANRTRAEANVKTREVDLRLARQAVDLTLIRSPIDGVVLSRPVQPDETVRTGGPLFRLGRGSDRLRLTAHIAEVDIGRVTPGQKVRFSVPAFPGRRYQGDVQRLGVIELGRDGVRRAAVEIAVASGPAGLQPGMSAAVEIETGGPGAVFRAPAAALVFSPDRVPADGAPAVWQRSETGVLQRISVEVGARDGQLVEISGPGLREGAGLAVGYAFTPADRRGEP